MCLIAFALGVSSRWPLVIAANRDEYWARPTAPLVLWQTQAGHSVLSGRDLRAGGTWMGTNLNGRVAFLTNVRASETLAASQLTSRGSLVTRWLAGVDETPAHMAAALQVELHSTALAYAGFNLVVGDVMRGQWHWISNRPGGSSPQAAPADMAAWSTQELPPGVYGLSNALLNTPWPKTTRLKAALSKALQHADNVDALKEKLWQALADRTRCAPGALPSTGVLPAVELALSSVCVDFPEQAYGTRSSAVWLATAGSHPSDPWQFAAEERTFAGQAPQCMAAHAMQWGSLAA